MSSKEMKTIDYEFDQEIDRFDTNCLKWEFEFSDDKILQSDRAHAKHGAQRLLPLWVADMDFCSPPAVITALEKRAAHGIYGYSRPDDAYYEAVLSWFARRYGWHIERDWILITPGVVAAIANLVQAFSEPGDKILIQPPVYHPFHSVVEENDRVLAFNPLLLNGDRYEMDFDDLEAQVADPALKMAILCSPHNPVGRVWTAEELARFGRICQANDVLVVSDEIHGDLIYDGVTFTSYAVLGEAFAGSSIICTAPSKTFNLAGLRNSNIVVKNEGLREAFAATLTRNHASGGNAFGLVAAEAAYRDGEPWLAAVMAYIQENYRFLESFLADHLPQIRVIPPEGTYLVWVDFNTLGLEAEALKRLLMEEAKVWLNEGISFGEAGAGFARINIACPRPILEEALERIDKAVHAIGVAN